MISFFSCEKRGLFLSHSRCISILYALSLALLTSCASEKGILIPASNATLMTEHPVAVDAASNTVQLTIKRDDGTTVGWGTGVALAGTDVGGYPAIVTVAHIGDLRDFGGNYKIEVLTHNGLFLGFGNPIYRGYPTVPLHDDVIALAIDPSSVQDSAAWSTVSGARLARGLDDRDLFAVVSEPTGLIGGDSGSGWYDKDGELVGLSSSTISGNQSTEVPVVGHFTADADQINGDESEDISSSHVTAPAADMVMIDQVDTSYLRNLFPGAYRDVTTVDGRAYPDAVTMGFGLGLFTVYHTPRVLPDDSCMSMVDAPTTPSDAAEDVGLIMDSESCRNDKLSLMTASQDNVGN